MCAQVDERLVASQEAIDAFQRAVCPPRLKPRSSWGALADQRLRPACYSANCTLCHQSLGDVYLRLGQPKEAEASMRRQVRTQRAPTLD